VFVFADLWYHFGNTGGTLLLAPYGSTGSPAGTRNFLGRTSDPQTEGLKDPW